jgi:hypothetical protein
MMPTLTRLRSEGRRARDAKTFPGDYDVTGLSVPNAFHAVARIPVDGEYLFKVGLGGLRPAGSEPITITLWVDEREVRSQLFDQDRFGRFADDRQDFGGQAVEFRVPLTAGDHRLAVAIPRIFEGLPARYGGPRPSTRPGPPPREFRPPANATPERIAQLRKTFDDTTAELERISMNGVRVTTVDIGGPYQQVRSSRRPPPAGVRAAHHDQSGAPRVPSPGRRG